MSLAQDLPAPVQSVSSRGLAYLWCQVRTLQAQLKEAGGAGEGKQAGGAGEGQPRSKSPARSAEETAPPVSRIQQFADKDNVGCCDGMAARLRCVVQEVRQNELKLDTPETRAYYESKTDETKSPSLLGWLF